MNTTAGILVVEDDPGARSAIEDLLQLHGYKVRTARDGLEALEIMHKQTPDLILADILMPGMNGYQFYLRVQSRPDWLWIPFIFLTAKGSLEDIRMGREMGVDDYIVKPFEPEDLLAAITGRLERFEQLAEADQRGTGSLVGGQSDMAALERVLATLSDREREVLMLICSGLSNVDIADRLFIAVSTVKTHVTSILAKLGVSSRTEAASIVLQAGLDMLDGVGG
jgi:DNA-binding NarL/FixJ family response regulator